MHDFINQCVGVGQHEVAQRDDADQVLLRIGNVHVVDGFGFAGAGQRTQPLHRLGCRNAWRHAEVAGRHQTARCILCVHQQLLDLRLLFLFHQVQDVLAPLLVHLVQKVSSLVGLHLFDDVRRALVAELFEHFGLELRLQLFDCVGDLLVVERADQLGRHARAGVLEDFGDVSRVQLVQLLARDVQANVPAGQETDIAPGNLARGQFAFQVARQPLGRVFHAEPPQEPAPTDVHVDQAIVGAQLAQFQVVDAHDAVVVGVDHLLVHQVARQPDFVAAWAIGALWRLLELDLHAREVFVAAPWQQPQRQVMAGRADGGQYGYRAAAVAAIAWAMHHAKGPGEGDT